MYDQVPSSKLTLERPDIWLRGLALATHLTGYTYARKEPLSDGRIYACGGAYTPSPAEVRERHRYEKEKRRREEAPTVAEIDDEISDIDDRVNSPEYETWKDEIYYKNRIEELRVRKEWLEKRRSSLTTAPIVYVPDGAMEWLLHEVGHYVVSTPGERALPNYGLLGDDDPHSAQREWESWGFEEIIFAPFGHARDIAPPSQRDGVGFSKAGPLPDFALKRAGSEMRALGIDAAQWRALYGEWITWAGRNS